MREPLHNYSNEEALLRAFREGQEKSFAEVFKTLYPALCFYALRITGDQSASEDIAGESFIKIWSRREQFHQFNILKSYLYSTTRNASLNWIKQSQRQQLSEKEAAAGGPESEKYVLEDIVKAELLREIYTALDSLPPQCRKIMAMLYIEGKNTGQIAKELQLALGTVKTQKARGVMLLRKKVSELIYLLAYFIIIFHL